MLMEREMEKNLTTVYIYIQSYDLAEPYLKRALDSILHQTYRKFICYIYDNCSGPVVRKIIQHYAAIDERFKLVLFDRPEKVIAWKFGVPDILNASQGKGYFTRIDADDALEVDALEKMVTFAEKNNLDMTVAGVYGIDDISDRITGKRCIERDVIVDGREYEKIFSCTYDLMRTHWLKLYRLEVIKNVNFQNIELLGYGSDTLFVRQTILHSNRIGVLAECLYRYTVYSINKKDYDRNISRIYAPEKLYMHDINFLLKKCGSVSESNLNFLIMTFLKEEKNCFYLIKQGVFKGKSIDLVYSIVCTPTFKLAVKTIKHELYLEIATWILEQDIFANKSVLEKSAKILATLFLYPDRLPSKDIEKELLLLLYIYKYWDECEIKSDLEKQILLKIQAIPLLAKCTLFFASMCMELFWGILTEDYVTALNWIIDKFENEEHYYLMHWELELSRLGLNISAILENAERFVWFKEKEIEYLLKNDEQAAMKELDDWKDVFQYKI